MNCDEEIRLIVYRRKDVFDDLQISLETVAKHQNNVEEKDAEETMVAVKFNRRGCDAYLASACITEMKASSTFRRSVLKRLSSLFDHDQSFIGNKVVFLKLLTPKHQFLDIKWNNIINYMIIERMNLMYAISWLSTLGGAFSALGDSYKKCATVAGKISIRQFRIALKLGDPSLVARCKLYACLSLIQRNKFKYPLRMIPDVFYFAKEINDVRLQRMCHGIWAKLRYQRGQKKREKDAKYWHDLEMSEF